jgi:cullin-associated NEDD8-dissociated protein 1
MVTLSAQDQLRQRMAWALSQILVVSPNQVNAYGLSEPYLNYYDIFVRNAFGNYRDVLKEVSHSPMMAEMLSFIESKSSGTYIVADSPSLVPLSP